MTVTVRRVPSREGLPAALRGIFVEAFPANEREPWVDLVTGHADDNLVVYTVEEDGEPVGFAALTPLTPLRAAILDYLAITPSRRNEGMGALLLNSVRAFGTGHGWGSGIAIEVEPATSPDPAVRADQVRRLDFYRRLGAVDELDVAYAMPDAETDAPLPMHLLVLPVDPAAPVLDVRDLVRGIYERVYPFHGDMLAAVLAGKTEALETRSPAALTDLPNNPRQSGEVVPAVRSRLLDACPRPAGLSGLRLPDRRDDRIERLLADPTGYYVEARERAKADIRARRGRSARRG